MRELEFEIGGFALLELDAGDLSEGCDVDVRGDLCNNPCVATCSSDGGALEIGGGESNEDA